MIAAIATAVAAIAIWQPGPGTSFQIQLDGTVDTTVDAQVYEIDGFDNTADTVATLHAQGRKAVCYIDAGTWENWRPDAATFPKDVLGKQNGWPGERWLDVRRLDVLQPIMRKRFDMCRAKGFDAIEADNVDGYQNATGFPLTAADQLAYNRWLAKAAHNRGLAIGLKNDPEQVGDLLPSFDFSVAEQCFQYDECDKLVPFVQAGKAVFDIEYELSPSSYCAKAASLGLTAIRKKLGLRAWRVACP